MYDEVYRMQSMLSIHSRPILVFVFTLLIQRIWSYPANETLSSHQINTSTSTKFLTLKTACTQDTLMVHATTSDPFSGVIYPKGYPLECRTFGNHSTDIQIFLKLDTCGVKVVETDNGQLEYHSHLYIQYDAKVQRAMDQHAFVKCTPLNSLYVSLHNGDDADRVVPPDGVNRKYSTSGATSGKNDDDDDNITENYFPPRCWLEILRGNNIADKPVYDHLKVGEDITMLIKIQDVAGLVSKVVNCIGHDGTNENQQPLLDSNGCAIDDLIMPQLTEVYDPKTKMDLSHVTFPAFKFPDRDNLYFKCTILLCKSKCPVNSCNRTQSYRKARHWYFSEQETEQEIVDQTKEHLIDTIDVFSSVEIQAPGIELESLPLTSSIIGEMAPRYEVGKVTCTSTSRLILVFGFLLGIFFVAVVFSIVMFTWSRLHRRIVCKSKVYLPYRPFDAYS